MAEDEDEHQVFVHYPDQLLLVVNASFYHLSGSRRIQSVEKERRTTSEIDLELAKIRFRVMVG